MAPGDRPLDFQIPPAADREADSLSPSPTLDSSLYFGAPASVWETLPLVRFHKEVQVEVVHVVLDVVPVRSHQFLVVVDLRLRRSTKNKISDDKTGRKARDEEERWRRYLSEEVADDGVGQGVSQTAELMGEGNDERAQTFTFQTFQFGFFPLNGRRGRRLPCVRPRPSIPPRTG